MLGFILFGVLSCCSSIPITGHAPLQHAPAPPAQPSHVGDVPLIPTAVFVSADGNDALNGTTASTAVRSLARAAALLASAPPPTSLLLRRGDTWTSELALTQLVNVTITSYGSPSASRPKLWRNNYTVGLSAVTLTDMSGVVISGIDIGRAFFGIRVLFNEPTGPTAATGPWVSDCVLRDVLGSEDRECLQRTGCWATAIHLGKTAADASVSTVKNLSITNTVAVNCDALIRNGAQYHGVVGGVQLESMAIRETTLHECNYNTVELINNTNSCIANCVFFRDGRSPTLPSFVAGTTDVIVGTVIGNAILNNEFASRGELGAAPDGCAIDFETNATGTQVAGNYISDSYGAGVMVFGHADGSNHELLLAHNVFNRDGCGQVKGDHGAIAFVHPGSTGRLKGNTYVRCSNASVPLFNDVEPNASFYWEHINDTVVAAGEVAQTPNLTVAHVNGCADVLLVPSIAANATESRAAGVSAPALAGVRYTTDGSAPTATSPLFPDAGSVTLCRSGVLNAKRFGAELIPSSTASVWVDVQPQE
eukprot:m.470483 g.470483  ORF g.470483 m.470483 type:complete len:536 (+) comp29849_c0_seq1:242-1849(+)